MFKLESYITPLLLGYVDKYIKNLKPEDFQLSLWGGDAVFTNLDIRLDILEQEFHLPFTFTNGHIHELRIHVPWTKLASESIVITIETIECVLALKDFSKNNGEQCGKMAKRRSRRTELQEAPPGYVQNFITRILNNICIVCNNLILKYVEDDIVFSLNIKSAEMYNVNHGWEKAFIDVSSHNPILRRIIHIHDLTVCLDKRNSSGIVEMYQDPLLFRCSAICRLYTAYDSPHSKIAKASFVSVYCDHLDFSITDQQLRMFSRLLELCIALVYGDFVPKVKHTSSIAEEESSELLETSLDQNQAGWGSWALSLVPQIIPLWDDNLEDQDDLGAIKREKASQMFQFRLLIDKTSCVFKVTNTEKPTKLVFRSVALSRLYGTSIEMTLHGFSVVNFQFGVIGVEISSLDDCICGGDNLPEKDKAYFRAGIMPSGGHTYSFVTSSLFDPLSPENSEGNRQEHKFDWENHVNCLTENIMLERYPAFGMDYIYEVEIPQDWSDKVSELTSTFLEGSNWREQALCRVVLGKCCIVVTSSLVHLLQTIIECLTDNDYPPYSSYQQEKRNSVPAGIQITDEDILALEDFVPIRTYHFFINQPVIEIHLGSHPRSSFVRKIRKDKKQISQDKQYDPRGSPLIVVLFGNIDIQLTKPMYPHRILAITSSVSQASQNLRDHCYRHISLKVFQFEMVLQGSRRSSKPIETVIILPCSLAVYFKQLLPSDSEVHKTWHASEGFLELDHFCIQLTKPQFLFIFCLIKSWLDELGTVNANVFALEKHVIDRDKSTLCIELSGANWHFVETRDISAHQGKLMSLSMGLNLENQKTVLLQAPQAISRIATAAYFKHDSPIKSSDINVTETLPFCSFTVQVPNSASFPNSGPVVILLQLESIVINGDPVIMSWLDYFPRENGFLFSNQDVSSFSRAPDGTAVGTGSAASSISTEQTSTFGQSKSLSAQPLLSQFSVPENDKKGENEDSSFCKRFLEWYQLLKCAIVQINISPSCILCPTSSLTNTSSSFTEGSDLLSIWRNRYLSGKLPPCCIISVPNVKISSHNSNWISLMTVPLVIPIHAPENTNVSSVKFPWMFSIKEWSAYTLSSNNCSHILKPINVSVSLAITESASATESSSSVQLAFCFHVDVDPVYLSTGKEQVCIMTTITDYTLNITEKILQTTKWIMNVFFSKVHLLNEPVCLESDYSFKDAMARISENDHTTDYMTAKGIGMMIGSEINLTLWMQWTLPKFCFSIFWNKSEEKDLWVQLEIEELTASLDVQDVFIKGKTKIQSFSISNFEKSCSDSSTWSPGYFDGIILCCTDKLNRNVIIPTKKNDRAQQKFFSDGSSSQVTHSFLSLTFTRALSSSAEHNWSKKLKDLSFSSLVRENYSADQQYIDEIDIQLSQFDVVLWMPLFTSMVTVFYPLRKLLCKHLPRVQKPVATRKKDPIGWNLATRNLPLVYATLNSVRVFFPSDQPIDKLDDKAMDKHCSLKAMNVCILQFSSVGVLPQADNLLSRTVIENEFYSAAQQSGTLHIPGFLIEDRQYQMDIIGLSLNSALWKDVCRISFVNGVHQSPVTLSQNPALEWNNRSSLTESLNDDDDDTSVFYPIAGPVDLRITAAPAIIFNTSNQDKLVCGHSVEISALSDIEMYLSFQQLSLLLDVMNNNFWKGLTELSDNLKLFSASVSKQTRSTIEVLKDSGIESELSALQSKVSVDPDLSLASILSQSLHSSLSIEEPEPQMKYVPSDLLLTARNIFISLYLHEADVKERISKKSSSRRKMHKRSKSKFSQKEEIQDYRLGPVLHSKTSPKLKHGKSPSVQRETTSNESSPDRVLMTSPSLTRHKVLKEEESEEGYEGSSDSSDLDRDRPDSSIPLCRDVVRIHPFLHISISQPHTFISCGLAMQKIEASCFDLQVQGGKNGCFIEGLGPAYYPMPCHYTQPWIESLPGDNDLKTGIPPPLYTVSFYDFLSWPAKAVVKFERPLLFHMSTSKLEQLDMVIESAKDLLVDHISFESAGHDFVYEENEKDTDENILRMCAWLTNVKKVEFSTVHIAFAMEASLPSGNDQFIVFSVSEARINAAVVLDDEGKCIRNVNATVDILDALMKTNSNSHSRHFLGPYTTGFNISLTWADWLSSATPMFSVHITGETLFITIGSKQLQILKNVVNHWHGYFQSKNAADGENTRRAVGTSVDKKKESSIIKTTDDIRNGSFQFVHDWDGIGMFPKPGEVVFCKDQKASMTWRYPQPRALTNVDIYPVPIQPVNGISEIQCSLQYWDSLKANFVTYKQFQLVESSTHTLDLPPATVENVHTLIVCDTWRVTLKSFDSNCDTNHLPVLPNVLAACMRVDSLFDEDLVSLFQASLHLGLIQATFCNHFRSGGTPDYLFPFSFDGLMPQDQEFMILTINGSDVIYKKWKNKEKVDVDLSISCELLEYRSLTMQLLLEPVDVQGQALLSFHQKNPPVVELGVYLHPCYVRVQQSTVHTLNIALQAWNQLEMKHHFVPHYYIFCNNTQETLRFGQVNTDESIILGKQQMHAYSWRSHKIKQAIRVCIESMQWKWSEPFSMDSDGVKVRIMDNKSCRTTLIIHVKCINAVQKQIIISGQLLVSSRLDFPLEMRLLTQQSPPHWMEHRNSPNTLPQLATIPAFMVTCSQPTALQVRLQSVGSVWSETIAITGRDAKSKQLLQIPNRDEMHPVIIWCHVTTKELLPNLTVYLVIFVPLFVIRNYLPRPLLAYVDDPNDSVPMCLEVYGQCQEKQLTLSGNVTNTRQLLFQMAAGMKTSSPAVTLPAVTLDDTNQISEDFSIEDLCYNWCSHKKFDWPFNDHSYNRAAGISDNSKFVQYGIPKPTLTLPLKPCEMPDTELQVEFSNQWPGFSTVVIDVKPWSLFVNHLSIDLYLVEASGNEWKILSGAVFTPPPLQSTGFTIGVEFEGELYRSDALLLDSEISSPKTTNVLSPGNKNHIRIYIRSGQRYKACCFCADVVVNEGITIVTFRPEIFITNVSGQTLVFSGYITNNDPSKVTLKWQKVVEVAHSEKRHLQALLFWDVIQHVQQKEVKWSYFLSFAHCSDSGTFSWSHPVSLLSSDKEDERRLVAVPQTGKDITYWHTVPYSLTIHKDKEMTYLVINMETIPLLVLHNNTNFTLCYGQAMEQPIDGATVKEELEPHGFLPTLPLGGVTFYTCPSVDDAFPNLLDQQPSIHFAKYSDPNSDDSLDFWSQAIELATEVDSFIHIPEAGDVRIHKEKLGHAIHLFVDSVNRIEVSAKEIRSRIGMCTKPQSRKNKGHADATLSDIILIPASTPDKIGDQQVKKHEMETLCQPFVYAIISVSHFCLITCDSMTDPSTCKELLRLSVDDALLVCRTLSGEASTGNLLRFSHMKQEIVICLSNIQVDNQMTGEDGNVKLDFQVILIPQKSSAVRQTFSGDLLSLSSVNKAIDNAALAVTIVLESSYCFPVIKNKSIAIQKLEVNLKPMSVYLEDALYYKLMAVCETFIPLVQINGCVGLSQQNVFLPKHIYLRAMALAQPLHLTTIHIKPLSLLVSLHVSLKLYLAIDHSPLAFTSFEKYQVYTTSYKLGQLLTVHYITGALLRAGWVVGSLDILGNPTGLARAIGSGISDLVLLPYKGMFRGPLYFIKGMSVGAASLMKQISSGAVLSVTNMATSIARNMDRLSLDREHFERQEELRHNIPQGVTTGIVQGLSGFGISLLGAVAGLVEHPLQAVASPTSSGAGFVFSTAAGIVTGAGKGIVGMVVKPIGGAAELVSQTGQGFLHGVGWHLQPSQRYLPLNLSMSNNPSSQLKLMIKVLQQGLVGRELVMSLEASHKNQAGRHMGDILLLTPEVLSVVSKDDDRLQQTFALTEITCCKCPKDSSVLYIMIKPCTGTAVCEEEDPARDRVAEYVHRLSTTMGREGYEQSPEQSPLSVKWRDAYQFFVYSKLRDVFVAAFDIEQRKATGKRFFS